MRTCSTNSGSAATKYQYAIFWERNSIRPSLFQIGQEFRHFLELPVGKPRMRRHHRLGVYALGIADVAPDLLRRELPPDRVQCGSEGAARAAQRMAVHAPLGLEDRRARGYPHGCHHGLLAPAPAFLAVLRGPVVVV